MELNITLTKDHLILLESIISPIRENESIPSNDGLATNKTALALLTNEMVLRASLYEGLTRKVEVLKRKNQPKTNPPASKDEVRAAKRAILHKTKAAKKLQAQRRKEAAKKAKEAAKKAKESKAAKQS